MTSLSFKSKYLTTSLGIVTRRDLELVFAKFNFDRCMFMLPIFYTDLFIKLPNCLSVYILLSTYYYLSMVATETISKETIFALTVEQEKTVTRIINKFVEQTVKIIEPLENSVTGTLREAVVTVCEDLNNAGIPKQSISSLVCQKADKFNKYPDYLRTFIPSEYKNQAQREIRLSQLDSSKNLPGIDDLDQHESININQFEFSHPPPNPNIGAPVKHQSYLIGRKEYDTLKAQFDASQVEIIKLKKQLDNVVVDINFLIALAEGNESNEELGEKVRVAVRDDPRDKLTLKNRN